MKRVISTILTIAMLCTVIVVPASAASSKIEPLLRDDFALDGGPYKIENMDCDYSDYDTDADNKKIVTNNKTWDVWMLSSTFSDKDYDKIEYNMVPNKRNADSSLTYYNPDFGGKLFSVLGLYGAELVEELADGDWADWQSLFTKMPFKLYAGASEDAMTELAITHIGTSAWYPNNNLEFIVDELPADTQYVKVVIPALDSDNYAKRKIALVTVTEDKSLAVDAYVNPFIPYTADEACQVKLSKFFVNGKESAALEPGSVYGKTVVFNTRSGEMAATMLFMLYKDGVLVDTKQDTQKISGYGTNIFSTENSPVTIPDGEDASAYNAKMWVVTDKGAIANAVNISATADITDDFLPTDEYAFEKITVITPKYTNEISGDTPVVMMAPGFKEVTAKCWQQGEGYGQEWELKVPVGENGHCEFVFPADSFPHGPLTIRLEAGEYDEFEEEWLNRDMNNLQVYNIGGVSWQEGLGEYADSIVPDVAKDLEVIFEDDFTNPDLSISRWDSSATYSSHKVGFGDYSGVYFRDYEDENLNAFGQVDTYLRIRADENRMSAGILSTVHQDYTGVDAMPPAYFEVRMVAPYATGTWPAIWFMNNNKGEGPCDEIDLLEAYGFDEYHEGHSNGYVTTFHEWGRETPTDPSFASTGQMCDMRKIGDGTNWYTKPHTYGYYMGKEETKYFIDGVEYWSHPTWPSSQVNPTYLLVNLAIGGSSGWPRDLSRYYGVVDMYVDYIRIFAEAPAAE